MGRRGSFPEIPVFENLFLKSIAEAFARRRKSLSHWCDTIELTCSTDLNRKVPFERLDLTLRFGRYGTERIHFTVWEDSMAWVWCGQHQKNAGWIFEVELSTELWSAEPGDIVERVEATRYVKDQAALQKAWSGVEKPIKSRKRKRR